MNYDNLIIKDSGDINLDLYPGCINVKTYRNVEYDKSKIKIMSTKVTKIGKKTIDDHPLLKYIISRTHGIDHIDTDYCTKRNIKVMKLDPYSESCSEWIIDKLPKNGDIFLFGNGSIGKYLNKKLNNRNVTLIDSKINKFDVIPKINNDSNIISTLPLNNKTYHYFDSNFLEKISNLNSIISISRGDVFDNNSLLSFLSRNSSTKCFLDSIKKDDYYDDLSKRCSIYKHVSWKFKSVDYNNKFKEMVDLCLKD